MTTSEKGQKNNPPVDSVRINGVCASIYANEIKNSAVPLYKVSVTRTYKQNNEFRTTSTFTRDDLPSLGYVVQEACRRIGVLQQRDAETSEKDTSEKAKETKVENE